MLSSDKSHDRIMREQRIREGGGDPEGPQKDYIIFECSLISFLFLLKTNLLRSESSKFESKICCPVMLTYKRSCLTLYRWVLQGINFENDADSVHIIIFLLLLKTRLLRSESSKFESKRCCPVMLIIKSFCLSFYRWSLMGSNFENYVEPHLSMWLVYILLLFCF